MYLIIHSRATGRDTRYDRLEALSFAPETDPTLSSLPVCECQADVVTEDELSVGDKISIYDDMDGQWFYQYWVTRAQRLSGRVVRIVAQSALALLDKVVLPPMMAASKTVPDHIGDVLAAAGYYNPDSEVQTDDYIDTLYDFSVGRIGNLRGFFPEQTARERIQWICQAAGLQVLQYGRSEDSHLVFIESTRVKYIPYWQTFWKPEIEIVQSVKTLRLTYYNNFTQTYHKSEGWTSGVVQEGYEDTETGVSVPEEIWYFKINESVYTSENAGATDTVTQSENTFLSTPLWQGNVRKAWFRSYDVRLDAINNGQYWPGDRVRFHIDEKTICAGVIKSCDFTFGQQARAKLVISTDLEPVDTAHITLRYEYEGRGLGRSEFYVPLLTTRWVTLPTFDIHVPGGVMRLVPPQSSAGVLGDQPEVERTYQYKLTRIKTT